MSRTYRRTKQKKTNKSSAAAAYNNIMQGWCNGLFGYLAHKEPTEAEIREFHMDKSSKQRYKQYCFNHANRVRRCHDRIELSKIYKLDDFEDANFDPSKGLRKWKSIWWEIY